MAWQRTSTSAISDLRPWKSSATPGLEAPLDDVRALVPVELLARMFAEVDGFAAGEHQADDMTALTLRLA